MTAVGPMIGSQQFRVALAAGLLLGIAPISGGDAVASRLWNPGVLPPGFVPAPGTLSSQAVVVDSLRLDSEPDSVLSLPLIQGDSLTIVRDRRETHGRSRLVWFGRVARDPQSFAMFSRVGDVVVGTVSTSRGRSYRLRYAGSGLQVFEEVDDSAFPDGATPRDVVRSALSVPDPLVCAIEDPENQIDVLVIYTAKALVDAGGMDAMEAEIHALVGATNQSYIDSDIAQRIRLVQFEQVCDASVEKVSVEQNHDALEFLASRGEPDLDCVHELRDKLGADCVVMIVSNSCEGCGISTLMREASTAHAEYAFAVVRLDCAYKFAFAHELGHIMGAAHDWSTFKSEGGGHTSFPYAHGFSHVGSGSDSDPSWRTVMSEGKDCRDSGITDSADCPRIAYWSDPTKSHNGYAMGVAGEDEEADNHRTLNGTATTVARFRCGLEIPTDAWMKDTWNDCGKEPEPGLGEESMWKSPYIWVRHEADPDRIHAHDHENPVRGRENYAYVKIRGGTVGITGNLELYAAPASSGLAWKDAWERIGVVTLSPLEAYDMRIVEFPWKPLESGHYCLVARWDAAEDPMAVPEGPEIEPNVRANNNLVWRNLNIVEWTGPPSDTVVFYMVNSGRKPAEYALKIGPSSGLRGGRFLRERGVTLRVGPEFRAAWVGEGQAERSSQGRGYMKRGQRLISTSDDGMLIEGLALPAGARIPVQLEFSRDPLRTAPATTFVLDAVQVETGSHRPRVIGGVSYEVRVGDPSQGLPVRAVR